MKPTVILVHVGDSFINYLNICLEQIKRFNQCEIIVATSESNFEHLVPGVNPISLEKLKKSTNHIEFLKQSKRDLNFRGGFWNSVIERFFIIEDIMIDQNLKNVFHFENDVMIYCNLDDLLNTFIYNDINMAAPFDNDERCIPSFVFINDLQVLSKLNQYMSQYNKFNDMELIAMFNKDYHLIHHLPVIPPSYDKKMKSKSGQLSLNPHKYYENFDKIGSLFDAAAIGQFLGGIDPRNTKKNILFNFFKRNNGFINESAVYDVTDFQFSWQIDDSDRKIPYLEYKGVRYKINNLHIHSKMLDNFR